MAEAAMGQAAFSWGLTRYFNIESWLKTSGLRYRNQVKQKRRKKFAPSLFCILNFAYSSRNVAKPPS